MRERKSQASTTNDDLELERGKSRQLLIRLIQLIYLNIKNYDMLLKDKSMGDKAVGNTRPKSENGRWAIDEEFKYKHPSTDKKTSAL